MPNRDVSVASIEACRDALDALAQEFVSGEITIDELEDLFKEEMKSEYIRQYLFGVGGLANMTPEDWQQVASDLEVQYKYAEDFIAELDDAAQVDDDGESLLALLWRFGLYAAGASAAFEIANGIFHFRNGFVEEFWVVDPSVENCIDCLAYQGMGWVEIGTFPEPGDWTTRCGANCYCYKKYRKADGTESLEDTN